MAERPSARVAPVGCITHRLCPRACEDCLRDGAAAESLCLSMPLGRHAPFSQPMWKPVSPGLRECWGKLSTLWDVAFARGYRLLGLEDLDAHCSEAAIVAERTAAFL